MRSEEDIRQRRKELQEKVEYIELLRKSTPRVASDEELDKWRDQANADITMLEWVLRITPTV